MIHLSQKLPEYLKLTGTSTLSWHESGLGNTQCDSSGSERSETIYEQNNGLTKEIRQHSADGDKETTRARAEFIFQKKANPKNYNNKKVPLIHRRDSKKNH